MPDSDRIPKTTKRGRVYALGLIAAPVVLVGAMWAYMVRMPGCTFEGTLPPLTEDQSAMAAETKRHVEKLAGEIGERNHKHHGALKKSADYIQAELEGMGYAVTRQTYESDGLPFDNLEAELKGASQPDDIVVIGAHYDAVLDCPAANDNGTGVASLLALARAFANRPQPKTVRFVAFANEEPPHFHTPAMGSLQYANRCGERKERIAAMLSLETMGYYRDDEGSQQYPFPFSVFYPDVGNFIAFVGDLDSRALVHQTVASFREHADFPSQGAAIPSGVPGAGWSDHWSFWQNGYPAVMVTDTAPFRYPHYHTPEDTPDKVDYEKLARVTHGLVAVITDLAR